MKARQKPVNLRFYLDLNNQSVDDREKEICVGEQKIILTVVSNTVDKNQNPISSPAIKSLCERAYHSEMNIYEIDPETFGIDAFNKAFLGNNKLISQPENYPTLPYSPSDIHVFGNSIMVFKHNEKDIGYFSALCLFIKKENSIHFRFMAGFEPEWRGKGFFYLPVLEEMIKTLEDFKNNFPNENPMVNVTQFAMVSAGTPGAMNNCANLFRALGCQVPKIKMADKTANDLGIMMGLGLIDPQNGISDIKMKVRKKTIHQNKQNDGAKQFDFFQIEDGSGITGRQELIPVDDLLNLKDRLIEMINGMSTYKAKL